MQKYVIALYIRLSIEDYKYDSLSIENQSLVLHEYAASMPEALNAEIMEFIDNGYSGTNFERPQVSWYIIPDHHPAIIEKAVFDSVQASQLRFSQPNKKKRDYPLKGKAFCGCCGHALSRTMQKTSYYYCRHSEADEESRCHKMRLNAAELEQAVFLTLKKQMEAAAPLAPDGTLWADTSVPERAEYEKQIETLQDGKRTLYERYLMGEIDLNTYKTEKAACDELLLKTKNAYAAVLAQAKQKQDEQARQDSRKEASKAIFDADTLTTELAELLIDRVLVYPDKRIEIAYKIQDIFD